MPKFRRLSGDEVVRILQAFGFEIVSQRGSHVRLERIMDERQQRLIVPVHGRKVIPIGTLRSIYRQASKYIEEEELRPFFYSD